MPPNQHPGSRASSIYKLPYYIINYITQTGKRAELGAELPLASCDATSVIVERERELSKLKTASFINLILFQMAELEECESH